MLLAFREFQARLIDKKCHFSQNLKAAEGDGGKRPIQELFEFEWTDGTSRLRMEANPNLFTNAFNAKVFVMFEDEKMRMSSQVANPPHRASCIGSI